jgi:hypothetical protein
MNWAIRIVIVLALLPVLAIMLYKPSRVFSPSMFGVKCLPNSVCIDDESRRTEAEDLYKIALREGQSKLGSNLSYSPRFIFCTTQECFDSFGFKKASAQTVGTVATVIGPKGWKVHYLKHELIHQWQADKLCGLAMYTAPPWITEGMAYALSNDPRPHLSEPWQSYREKFSEWYSGVERSNLVAELKNAI